jgi:predicted nucleotidyltransferase/DNA-binding HxlR family transcriptional regulator
LVVTAAAKSTAAFFRTAKEMETNSDALSIKEFEILEKIAEKVGNMVACVCSQNSYNRSDIENVWIRMAKQAIELMFNRYRRTLLAQLFLRPDERFHLRELARMTEISAGSIHRELKAMAEAGLLIRTQVGNQVLYQADPGCSIYEELASIFRKTTGLAKLLGDQLNKISDNIDVAIIFGSMASGQQNSESDVDVLVLGDLELLDVVKVLSPVGQTLRREINPVVMTAEVFAANVMSKDRFALRIVEEPKIFVIGDADEFAKPGKDRSGR